MINGTKYIRTKTGFRPMVSAELERINPYYNGERTKITHSIVCDKEKNQRYIIFEGNIYLKDEENGNLYNATFEQLKPILKRFKETYNKEYRLLAKDFETEYSFSETDFKMFKLINDIFPEKQQVFFDIKEKNVYTNYQEDTYSNKNSIVFWNSNSNDYPLKYFKDGDKDCLDTTDIDFTNKIKIHRLSVHLAHLRHIYVLITTLKK